LFLIDYCFKKGAVQNRNLNSTLNSLLFIKSGPPLKTGGILNTIKITIGFFL